MILINLLEDIGPINREPARAREVMEVALVMFFVTAAVSTLILFILTGLVSIFTN